MTPNERAEFIADIASAIRIRSTDTSLTEEEISYVRLAIQKESQSIKLRQAVIEKTITGLVWMVVMGSGALVASWLNQHGMKV